MFKNLLAAIVVVALAIVSSPSLAEEAVSGEVTSAIGLAAGVDSNDSAQRSEIADFLGHPVIAGVIAEVHGTSASELQSAVAALSPDEVQEISTLTSDLRLDLAGGDRIVITTTTIIIVLLVVLILLAVD